jgi:hypothetical protein
MNNIVFGIAVGTSTGLILVSVVHAIRKLLGIK